MNKNRHKKKRVSDELYLLTSKAPKSLNSQFRCQSSAYLHSDLGYKEDEEITITSSVGSGQLKVKLNDDLREDCILIYSGTSGVNNLTSSKHSYEGKAASYHLSNLILDFTIKSMNI